MTKPTRSGTGQEQAKQGKTREASIRYDLGQDDWELAGDQGNKHFAGQMRLHLGPSVDGLRSEETRELLVRRGIRFIAFRCRTHAPKWPTLADQLVNALAATLADFTAIEEAVGYGRPQSGDEVTVECVLSPDGTMEADLLDRTGAGLGAVGRLAAPEYPGQAGYEIIAKPLEIIQDEWLRRREPQEDEQRREDRLRPATEQFIADLVGRLKRLVPSLPQDPEAKAQTLLALNRSLNESFWTAVRGELTPLIKPLLQDVPSDYDGKRARAALINAVLSAYGLAIQIEDDHGRRHLCSLYAVRARESDGKGNLRLLERTASGSSRRSYSIPAPDHLQLVETPRDEPNLKSLSADRDRSG